MRRRASDLNTTVGVGAGLALLVLPMRWRWSRRSRRLLAASAAGLIGVPALRRGCGWGAGVERAAAAFIGLVLGGAQYLLSEEDSSVRGAIATIGGLLLLFALLMPDEPKTEERRARSE